MIYRILCRQGDAEFDYDVGTAELKFAELKSDGLLPMVVSGGKHLPIKEFDPLAEQVVWVPAVAGG